ncbi:pimeloyl-[acyl-carrier protein] methyl ester esterase [Luteibacter jiangsuensis]|uniref:Pimeloyl-[acyl-carrier protein] methyl ester esterase n=1 Tax=Luteibacter jiangsuensis TaxID=637577 RepID=A0ABT9SXH4_9GAMM|nr:pimeloyl-ACP methyl ester esterase BioH [Luteibacter jiangsuensis]MDQ0009490.1 pimeloyl-[acyl-carrier protein] methyl ester esterase [Luteibacter jiangsuensis]
MSGLHIETHGTGPVPLVMIHGWAMHGGIFAPLVEALAARCTMYVVDLPGHGYSRDSDIPLEPLACARAIAAATPPATWLGWSMGGLVALAAALDVPGAVHAVVPMCSTPCFVRGEDWPYGNDVAMVHRLAADLEDDYMATVERFIALEAMGSADPRSEARRLKEEAFARGEPDPRVLLEGLRLLEATDLRPSLARLRPPSLWIAGRRDRIVHPEAMRWSAGTAHGHFAEIAHAGHAPFIGHAAAVADVLTQFTDADA